VIKNIEFIFFNILFCRSVRNGEDFVCAEEDEADTDLETDRLLGQQRTDNHSFFDDKNVSMQCNKM